LEFGSGPEQPCDAGCGSGADFVGEDVATNPREGITEFEAASFLKFFTNVCNAARELTEQNPQACKQCWWKRIARELHKTNAKLALSRSAGARRALFRLPTGASDEMYNDEAQTDLPSAAVANRSSHRDRQRHSRDAWTSRFRARHARPTT
jgi:hypothetical protein